MINSETMLKAAWWLAAIVASVAFFWFTAGMPVHKLAIALMASVISLAVLLGLFEGIWCAATQAFKGTGGGES